ncbi:WD40 repeat domain-containing protein, partial [Streptomyces sp. NPDC002540]
VAVTGSSDGKVRVWDLPTGQQIGEPLTGHAGGVRAVATTVVDGRPVAVTGSDDNTARVWDLATGRLVERELVFPTGVNAVTVSPDGRLVVGFGHEVAVLTRC